MVGEWWDVQDSKLFQLIDEKLKYSLRGSYVELSSLSYYHLNLIYQVARSLD